MKHEFHRADRACGIKISDIKNRGKKRKQAERKEIRNKKPENRFSYFKIIGFDYEIWVNHT